MILPNRKGMISLSPFTPRTRLDRVSHQVHGLGANHAPYLSRIQVVPIAGVSVSTA
jgi:hypothetical protein